MVETVFFPRPHFGSYFQSDDRTDSLSYYEYQRLQRLQKVARLQERRTKSYEPGYKKTLVAIQPPAHAQVATRQIFTKLKADALVPPAIPPLKRVSIAANANATSPSPPSSGAAANKKAGSEEFSVPPLVLRRSGRDGDTRAARSSDNAGVVKREEKSAQTERPSKAGGERGRLVKSATARDPRRSPSQPLPRPKTCAVGVRDVRILTSSLLLQQGTSCAGEKEKKEENQNRYQLPRVSMEHIKLSEAGDEQLTELHVQGAEVNHQEREELAQGYIWTTSTQRANNEIGWNERVPPPLPPPSVTMATLPDPVSQRLTFRRYHSCLEPWQLYGSEWDYVQTRSGEIQCKDPVNFCAPTRYNQYIPGYTGCIPGNWGEMDHPNISRLLVRRLTPRPTTISRKANIPGYTGHTHWARFHPSHTDVPPSSLPTSARVHREIPIEGEPSPFNRTSVLSKTVTLVSPHNPFNKINHF